MRRPGWILAEAVMGIAVIAAAAAGAFPLMARLTEGAGILENDFRADEEAFFSADYMADRIRYSAERTVPSDHVIHTSVYAFMDYAEDGTKKDYWLMAEEKEWRIRLYNGNKQPITGDGTKDPYYKLEALSRSGETLPYFTIYPHGLVRVAYRLRRIRPAAAAETEMAVLPLYDYFLVGEPYE